MTKECVHTQLHEAKVVDFTQDSEYIRMFKEHTVAMKQQSELIEQWVEKEEKKRLPPKPPMTPFS